MQEKSLVEKIFTEKAKNDSNSKDLARTLEMLSKTVFGEVNRFVFELLQNADDAATKDGKQIDVQFHLLDNYLIFSHDGEHFDANDVWGISGVANSMGEKDKAEEKTGYKGIGFKSVFGSSTYVHILSGQYSFRFDKEHEFWNGKPHEFPWQVVPIWTEQPANDVEHVLDKNRVTTIIRLTDRGIIKREILKVFEDCQIMLFLRRVTKISFFDHDKKVFELEKQKSEGSTIGLFRNDVLQSSWRIDEFEIAIPAQISSVLQFLGPQECPDKLKNATRTKLTFAGLIKDDKITSLSDAVIYSYLPTNSSYGFGFLINGDFLMDAPRTGLMSGVWNDFLFTSIAKLHLEWALELQKEKYRFEVPKLIRTKFKGANLKSFQLAFNEQLQLSLAEIPFLLDKKEETYHTLEKCIVDNVNFSEQYFSEDMIRDFLEVAGDCIVINYQYQSTGKLIELGAKSFGEADVFMMIEKGFFSGWKDSYNLSFYLHYGAKRFNSTSWDKSCGSARFLADEDNVMHSPKDIFFPFKNGETLPDIDRTELHFINAEILELYDLGGDTELVAWLYSLGVREPTETEIAKKSILPMVKKDKITAENSLNLTRLLVRVHARNDFDEDDYKTLYQMKLITSQGLGIANKCYLLPEHGGEQELARILPNEHFVSLVYTNEIDEEDIPHYRVFFKKIGCSASISVYIIDEATSILELENRFPASKGYFDWLEHTDVVPSIYRFYRYSQHKYSGFTRVDFLQQLHQFTFAKHFWNLALKNWDVFMQNLDLGRYHVYRASFQTKSFVQYYAMKMPVVPCADGQCRPGEEVFAPTLKNIVGQCYPVADFPASISASQRDFFALKKTISIAECMQLLTTISRQPISTDSVKQIHAIYGQIVGMGIQNDFEQVKLITDWVKAGLMLSSDNTFQRADGLWFFNAPGLDSGKGSGHFVKLSPSMEVQEKEAFCDLFAIPVITVDKLDFLPEKAVVNKELPAKIFVRINHLALITSTSTLEDFYTVLKRMTGILRSTRFYQAEKLSFVFKDTDGNLLYESTSHCTNVRGQGFYFVGQWSKTRTLFELIDPLCDLFSIHEFAREVQLLMQLDDTDAKDWLLERGFAVDLLGVNLLPQVIPDEIQTESFTEEEKSYDYEIAFTTESFEPEVSPDEIDMTDFHPVAKVYNNGIALPAQTYVRPTDQDFMDKTGRWTEEFVFAYLTANPDLFTEVIWVNEEGESGLPYDFECVENGNRLWIDAKGTPSPNKAEIYLSRLEWAFMFEKGDNYSLFHVLRVGYSDMRFERINEVAKKVLSGKVLPNPIALII